MVADIVQLYGPGMSFYLPKTEKRAIPTTITPEEKQSSLEVCGHQTAPKKKKKKTSDREGEHADRRALSEILRSAIGTMQQQPGPRNQDVQVTLQHDPPQARSHETPTTHHHRSARTPSHLASGYPHPSNLSDVPTTQWQWGATGRV